MRRPTRDSVLPLAWSFAALVATIACLHSQGRVWWCSCGSWNPVSFDAYGPHNSQHFLDPYSLSHMLHGVIFFGGLACFATKLPYLWRFFVAVLLECGWELLENSAFVIDRYRTATAAVGYVGDSVLNTAADVASCGFGFWLAGKLGLWKSAALYAIVEIGLLVLIRDNLTLNVVMLVYPMASVRAWQAGS